MSYFNSLDNKFSFPKKEHEILDLWEKNNTFDKSIAARKHVSKEDNYVFYDGPPFATGLPHYGHLVASTLKDIVPRYWTMRGKYVQRRFGWDTHGLPVEMETEKKLNLSGPSDIKKYGIDKFNEACREGVLKYTKEWQQTITRLGRWVDFENNYKTMDLSFMESVWWSFAKLWEKGLVYQGFKVMPYSWRLCTALSNFEANLDYRDVQDPAIFVTMPLINFDQDNPQLLVWTTTPWTLPSNLAVAVGSDIDYIKVSIEKSDEKYIIAKELAKQVFGKYKVIKEYKGKDLVGFHYKPLFDYFTQNDEKNRFSVISSNHVTTADGTGLVHMAPAYGVDDMEACARNNISIVDPVDSEGNFTSEVEDFAGMNIKEADKQIIKDLKDKKRLFKQSTIQHSYPYCWRSHTPLIYKAVPVWQIKVTAIKEQLVKNNEKIHWVPSAIGEKRFANWLKDAQDWTVSRSRFWGTPIPIWQCSSCEEKLCLGSVAELEALSGEKINDIHSHKIAHITINCPNCSNKMHRIDDVFDCWFESGSMPYAEIHYPFENKDNFSSRLPAQFIAEGLDQTRGWFYTLLVLSTALFDKPPFKNVIVNGLVLAKDGSKMSKSKRNYPDPAQLVEQFGADALRIYLVNSPVVRAQPLIFKEDGVKEVVRTVMLPLFNAWSFFVQYANIDNFNPNTDIKTAPKLSDRPEIDRWILSTLQSLIKQVNTSMEEYHLYKVVGPVVDFIDDLTNWYIRRNRRRFWKDANNEANKMDKFSAYATLYEVLITFAKVLAPIAPFLTESIYQNLAVKAGCSLPKENSIHMCKYPQVEYEKIDENLEKDIHLTRQIVKMGRALREKYRIKIKQPLKEVIIVTHDKNEQEAILNHQDLIMSELNVKNVIVNEDDSNLSNLQITPNYKTLGRRYGKDMKKAANLISEFGRNEYNILQSGQTLSLLNNQISYDDIAVSRQAKDGVLVQSDKHLVVALNTQLDASLEQEGLMRELTSHLQKIRKENEFRVTDRIDIFIETESKPLISAINSFDRHIKQEVLARNISVNNNLEDKNVPGLDILGHSVKIKLLLIS